MGKYEIAKKIVESGDSKIFKMWHDEVGVTQEEFLDGLKWLYEDPGLERDENGSRVKPLERELGCQYGRGLVRLKRVKFFDGIRFCEESGASWGYGGARMLEDGSYRNTCVSINAEDRI